MPTYNEAATIKEIIDRVVKADTLGLNKELIIVNHV